MRAEPPRRGAVLILVGVSADRGPDVLLTQRSATLRHHPGQISFPGGAIDDNDPSPAQAAVREAVEETGLDPVGVDVLGQLPEVFLRPSNFLVTPILAWWTIPSRVAPVNPAEVAQVRRVPLAELIDPENRGSTSWSGGRVGPAFRASGFFIWGFTAAILSQIIKRVGLEQPWTQERFFDFPEGLR